MLLKKRVNVMLIKYSQMNMKQCFLDQIFFKKIFKDF